MSAMLWRIRFEVFTCSETVLAQIIVSGAVFKLRSGHGSFCNRGEGPFAYFVASQNETA